MKVYFTASTTGNGKYQPQYQKVINLIEKLGHQLISGEQIIKKNFLSQDQKLTKEQIFSRQKQRIEQSDCVIAEVTSPSHGVGGEIAYALIQEKPALSLFYKNSEDKLSPMIAGNPSDNLYLEHYDDNLKIILKDFLVHVQSSKQRKGRLIVIEGGDGSGKTTQASLLVKLFKEQGKKVKYMDFPRYYSSFHGKIVGDFLAGKFGKLNEVSPYLISLAYALDRASAKEEMEEWLGQGGIIVSNRYATSNMAHQTARLPQKEKDKFLEWLDRLEYRVHKIPRPDLIIYLYVPWKIGMELTAKKIDKRRYIKGMDIAEADIKHRQESEKMYLYLAKNKRKWIKIDCTENNKILPKEKIHEMIVETLKKKRVMSNGQ
ncbi:nucleoside 2-deoxyribosyltransferase [Candidatus Microgenomates bacterium]|nr:nucleoside 2-deoxyribosyltransferase [Candidatus Microgenomates bacterium]